MYFTIPDDERLHIDKSMPDRIVLTGLNVMLDSNQQVQGRALIVRATKVHIYGSIRLPSGDIEIFAQQIVALDDVTLDVSGTKGIPDYTNSAPASSGQAPGKPGFPGDNGGDGKDGGRIAIFAEEIRGNLKLLATGGTGGKAQSGGNGINGGKGANSVGCGGAQTGQTGGAAAPAGKPGKGGDGGYIQIAVLSGITTGQIYTSITEGSAGDSGVHGKPGIGGPGGDGGAEGHMSSEPCRPDAF